MNNEKSSVVKIDSILSRKIEEFIQKEENRLTFVNKKQFVDLATSEFLRQQAYLSSKAKKMEKSLK